MLKLIFPWQGLRICMFHFDPVRKWQPQKHHTELRIFGLVNQLLEAMFCTFYILLPRPLGCCVSKGIPDLHLHRVLIPLKLLQPVQVAFKARFPSAQHPLVSKMAGKSPHLVACLQLETSRSNIMLQTWLNPWFMRAPKE